MFRVWFCYIQARQIFHWYFLGEGCFIVNASHFLISIVAQPWYPCSWAGLCVGPCERKEGGKGEDPMWLQRWGVWKGAEGDGANWISLSIRINVLLQPHRPYKKGLKGKRVWEMTWCWNGITNCKCTLWFTFFIKRCAWWGSLALHLWWQSWEPCLEVLQNFCLVDVSHNGTVGSTAHSPTSHQHAGNCSRAAEFPRKAPSAFSWVPVRQNFVPAATLLVFSRAQEEVYLKPWSFLWRK